MEIFSKKHYISLLEVLERDIANIHQQGITIIIFQTINLRVLKVILIIIQKINKKCDLTTAISSLIFKIKNKLYPRINW